MDKHLKHLCDWNNTEVYEIITKNSLKLLAYDIILDKLYGKTLSPVAQSIIDNDFWFSHPIKLTINEMTWFKNGKVSKSGVISFSLPDGSPVNNQTPSLFLKIVPKIKLRLYEELKNKIISINFTEDIKICYNNYQYQYVFSKRYNIFKPKYWKFIVEKIITTIRYTGYDIEFK